MSFCHGISGGNSSYPHFSIPTSFSLIVLHSVIRLHMISISSIESVTYAASSGKMAPFIGKYFGFVDDPYGTGSAGTAGSSHKSLIYMLKRTGLRGQPCLTSRNRGNGSVLAVLLPYPILTLIVLAEYRFSINRRRLPVIPNRRIFAISAWCGTLSYAFLKSMKMA